MDIFFSDDDRQAYIDLLAEQSERFRVHYLAWCLMTNHVHLIAVPEMETSLAKGIGEAHKRYSRMVNFREGLMEGVRPSFSNLARSSLVSGS
jgi:putative transposase